MVVSIFLYTFEHQIRYDMKKTITVGDFLKNLNVQIAAALVGKKMTTSDFHRTAEKIVDEHINEFPDFPGLESTTWGIKYINDNISLISQDSMPFRLTNDWKKDARSSFNPKITVLSVAYQPNENIFSEEEMNAVKAMPLENYIISIRIAQLRKQSKFADERRAKAQKDLEKACDDKIEITNEIIELTAKLA